jgi:hypothetical protein
MELRFDLYAIRPLGVLLAIFKEDERANSNDFSSLDSSASSLIREVFPRYRTVSAFRIECSGVAWVVHVDGNASYASFRIN